jgi:hypothetical protein
MVHEKSIESMLGNCKESKLLKRNLERLNSKVDKFNKEMKDQQMTRLQM